MRHSLLFLSASFLMFALQVQAADPKDDWDPAHEVRPFHVIGSTDPKDREIAEANIAHLEKMLHYWKAHGLPNPPDLEGVYFIASYDGLKIVDLLKLINPSIPDIRKHIEQQYERLKNSKIGDLIAKIDEKVTEKDKKAGKEVKTPVLDWMFDYYATIRYGFSVTDFYKSVKENKPLSDVTLRKQTSKVPYYDNAFYARFPRVDLTEIIPVKKGGKSKGDIDPDEWIDMEKMKEVMKGEPSRRIIILPRTTQKPGEHQISTVKDQSVVAHELGHHMNSTLAGKDKHLDLLVDEAFADFFAATPDDNPEIGKYFAEASKVVSDRLRDSEDSNERIFSLALEKWAEKGVIRNLSQIDNIDSISRKFLIADPYEAGNPLRTFLWQVSHDPRVNKSKLEDVLMKTIPAVAQLPVTVPTRSLYVIYARTLWKKFTDWRAKNFETKRILRELGLDGEAKKDARDEQKDVISFMAGKAVRERRQAREKNAAERRQFLDRFGFGSRPPVSSDYVLPEFFRVMFAEANAAEPQLAEVILEHAKTAMNSDVLKLEVNGKPQIVFMRQKINANPIAKAYLTAKFRKLERIGKELKDWERLSKSDDVVEKVKRKYSRTLEHITEYERSGSAIRLFVPHPKWAAAQIAWLTTKMGLKASLSAYRAARYQLRMASYPLRVAIQASKEKKGSRTSKCADGLSRLSEKKKGLR